MALTFEFATAGRVLFGPGRVSEIPALARELGRSVLLVVGKDTGRVQSLYQGLQELGLEVVLFQVFGEPRIEDVQAGVSVARGLNDVVLVGFGGGSVLDAAKAISIMLRQDGDVLDFLEVIGNGRTLKTVSAPCIAVPTTAGTGTEVTRNAVLASPVHRVKASLRSNAILPRIAVVDPRICLDLPAPLTAFTGMDALTQLIEPYVCSRANPAVDGLCVEGMKRSVRSLFSAWKNPGDLEAREDLCVASLHSGWALANAGLGAVHGFAAPIGGMFSAPHGAVCAALLAPVMRANIARLQTSFPSHPSLERYRMVAAILTQNAAATSLDGPTWVEALACSLGIPGLRTHGIQACDFPSIAAAALKASSMKANPVLLSECELLQILESAW